MPEIISIITMGLIESDPIRATPEIIWIGLQTMMIMVNTNIGISSVIL
jgi:hypothetical protein